MAHGRQKSVPFTIAAGQYLSAPVDLGPTGVLVGIVIDGAWTPAKISFLGYVEQSGKVTGPSTLGPDAPWTDPNAVFDQVKDNTGTTIQVGNGLDIAKQFLTWPDTFFNAVRILQVASGTVAAQVVQAAARTGYLIVRDLR